MSHAWFRHPRSNCSSHFCWCWCHSISLAVKVFAQHSESVAAAHTSQPRANTPGWYIFCLFVLLIISGSTKTLEGFHKNILLARWLSPFILPIFLWALWRYSSLQQVNRRYLAGEPGSAQWERRMSVAFCSLLFTMFATAFILGANGIYLK